jgi:folate-binding protein YgfZ
VSAPLAAAVQALGGQVGNLRGRAAVRTFGDVAGEGEALAGAVGLVPLLARTLVAVVGKDRTDYLHRMLTQDVAGLQPDRGARACFLTPTGRILGSLTLWNLGEPFLLDFDPGAAATALPGLERYVIADDVAFTDVSAGHARALLLGPGTAALLTGVGVADTTPGTITEIAVAGARVWFLAHAFGSRTGAEVLIEEASAARASEAFRTLAGLARPCGEDALESARVEEGVPAFGAELDERVLPNEARLEEALSWTKGCYPGQEPVVMAKHRGHPASLLVRLAIEAAAAPAPGAALLSAGKPMGRITSVAPGRAGLRGLGYVRHALARGGVDLGVEGGGTARVL